MSAVSPLSPDAPTPWVVCLCAAWCGTCRDYRAIFDALVQQHPEVRFEWVDIEDEADLAGDLDVETFPTVLVAQGAEPRFLGPILPHAGVLTRLLEDVATPRGGVPAEAREVLQRVQAARAG